MVAEQANDVWSVDVQFDSIMTGPPIEILSIPDRTHQGMSWRHGWLLDHLHRSHGQLSVVALECGMPGTFRMDGGPELISNALAEWTGETDTIFIPPGQPKNGCRRVIGREAPQRMPRSKLISQSPPCQKHHRRMEGRIQHPQVTLILGTFNTQRLCWPMRPLKTSDDYRGDWAKKQEEGHNNQCDPRLRMHYRIPVRGEAKESSTIRSLNCP